MQFQTPTLPRAHFTTDWEMGSGHGQASLVSVGRGVIAILAKDTSMSSLVISRELALEEDGFVYNYKGFLITQLREE